MSLRPMIRVVTFVTDVNDHPTDNFSMVMDLSYCSGRGSNPGTSNYHLRSANTGISQLVRFFGPQQTALLEKPH